jgi:hypothetical protein
MTEYFLADRKAEERAKARQQTQQGRQVESQDVKVTLLGDFLIPTATGESRGFDPYNSMQGRSARDMWRMRTRR